MNRFLLLIICIPAVWSCREVQVRGYDVHEVTVRLVYPEKQSEEDEVLSPQAGVTVKMYNSATSGVFTAKTDAGGKAVFLLPDGIYDLSATEERQSTIDESRIANINGSATNVEVGAGVAQPEGGVGLALVVSYSNNVIIKEMYFGGCPKDDGSGTFSGGQYIILYNNSAEPVSVGDYCFAMAPPGNAYASNPYNIDGTLTYEAEGWVPAMWGLWTFRNNPEIAPGEDLVIALNYALDNSATYSQAINFNNPAYYTNYDPVSGFGNTSYYPLPPVIPESNHLRGASYSSTNAWAMSVAAPAFFIFSTGGDMEFDDLVRDRTDTENFDKQGNNYYAKVKTKWIKDGIEVFKSDNDGNKKRLTAKVDAGYVNFTNQLGYTVYRNVNRTATEALPENEGKLVYGYDLGTEAELNGSTDQSGIDAEASRRNGARIIYMDTNNSTQDFHQRRKSSLRD